MSSPGIRLLLADCPWRYGFSRSKSRRVENHYPTMTLPAIKALDVASICARDCVLFLWATSPKLLDAIDVMQAWGFTYKTSDVWRKTGRKGMGYYFRNRHELILLGIRGRPPLPEPARRLDSVFDARVLAHSRKPPRAHERIEFMYPDLAPKAELFARRRRPGWLVWGNEIEPDFTLR